MIVSSLLFGIFHGNIHQGINGVFFGLILGFIYLKTGTLILSIFLHFVNNAFFTILEYIPLEFQDRFMLVDVYELLFGLAILIIGLYGFNKIKVDSKRYILNSKIDVKEQSL